MTTETSLTPPNPRILILKSVTIRKTINERKTRKSHTNSHITRSQSRDFWSMQRSKRSSFMMMSSLLMCLCRILTDFWYWNSNYKAATLISATTLISCWRKIMLMKRCFNATITSLSMMDHHDFVTNIT